MRYNTAMTVKAFSAAVVVAVAFGASSCFSGIESTPKITGKELKRQKVNTTPEIELLADVSPQAPRDWSLGKRFYVSDSRATRAFWRIEPEDADPTGLYVTLEAVDTVPALTGDPQVELTLRDTTARMELIYRTTLPLSRWKSLESYEIPYLVDCDIVESVAERLKDRRFYYLQPRRFNAEGKEVGGMRYVPVDIVDVMPGDTSRPLRVFFRDTDGLIYSVFMTLGRQKGSLRNFDTLFSIGNPRDTYRAIADDVWQLIQQGKVRLGMTPEECRLSLGAPDTYRRVPTTAGMVERWSYNNGAYLVFEEGQLSLYRL